MLEIIKNKSTFSDQDLIRVVRRENNAKRNYLLVNSMQGKHVPANPDNVLKLYNELAKCLQSEGNIKNAVFIGFAETATAVGAGVASCFENSYYLHTTREVCTSRISVADFREEHSHATEQLLYCDEWENIISKAENIVFVEDEISTGKTIMNFINALKTQKKVSDNIKFSACSILNGMTEECENGLRKQGMNFFYLVKHRASPDSDEVYSFNPVIRLRKADYDFTEIKINGKINPRFGSETAEYINACSSLADKISEMISTEGKNVAVIGTEECMYPAIKTAQRISRAGVASVVTHSTTRSPIVADNSEDYPLKSRYQVESFYDKERKTFIYNSDINRYDLVLVVTDSEKEDYDFTTLADAFPLSEKFILVRWVK
ncbi:MAG: phosphoribosyltransferase domain-containing protein [Oscillospiraceae bacterium]|nr:phosphoribosyltransferase domain-containing protein [Oscillospiraceae bacterium]